jgi:hypothetical protein
MTGFGNCWSFICLDVEEHGVEMPATTASSSTLYSGLYGQARPGVICHLITEIWKNTHRRFCRWRDKGIWEKLLEIVIQESDFEWLMIGASHVKVHPHAAGANGGNQDMARTEGGSTQKFIWPWMRMVCQSECILRKVQQRIAPRL